jgi:hypothetical protein
MKRAILGFVLAYAVTASAQTLDVKIVDRQDNQTDYTYIVPGSFNSQSNSNVDCNTLGNNTNCNGTTTTNGTTTPARQVSYRVRGATLTLLLPDGRGAIVNCDSEFAERFAGASGNHRSCLYRKHRGES